MMLNHYSECLPYQHKTRPCLHKYPPAKNVLNIYIISEILRVLPPFEFEHFQKSL